VTEPPTDPPSDAATAPTAQPAGPVGDEDRPELLTGGMPRHLRDVVRRADSYGFVFVVLTILIWGLRPFFTDREHYDVVLVVVAAGVIALVLSTSRVQPRTMVIGLTMAVSSTVLAIWGEVADVVGLTVAGHTLAGLTVLGAGSVVVVRIFRHQVVTSRTLFGAVSVYLMVGLAFAQLFIAVEAADPGAFVSDHLPIDPSTLVYLSLVTLATLGYGDVTPVSDTARSLATFETIMGQIFLVTVVARLVGMFGQARRSPSAHPAPDPGA